MKVDKELPFSKMHFNIAGWNQQGLYKVHVSDHGLSMKYCLTHCAVPKGNLQYSYMKYHWF